MNSQKPKYWQSPEELIGDQNVLLAAQAEFQSSPLQEPESAVERRDFLKLMAASTALASFTACVRRPVQKIVPYVQATETTIPGVAAYYASTCNECSSHCGILVKTREGRPIKIEGNPDHPVSKGGSCAKGQASILNLYDPDRARKPGTVARGSGNVTEISWSELDQKAVEALSGEKRVRILTGNVSGPSTKALIKDFLGQFKNSKHVVFEPLSLDQLAEGQQMAYGTAVVPRYNFEKADVIVSLGADFLGGWLSQVEHNRGFAKKRKLNREQKKMSRLYVFEPGMSLTGTNADVRYAVKSGDQLRIALALAHEITVRKVSPEAAMIFDQYTIEKVSQRTGVPAEVLRGAASSLWDARGRGLVVGSDVSTQDPTGSALEVVVSYLNTVCGNEGVTVDGSASPSQQASGNSKALAELVREMSSGAVDVLIVHGTNPAFTAPNSGFAKAAEKVPKIISMGDRVDETGVLSDMIAPDHHSLESWGDAEPQKGLYSIVQPTISPIYDTRQFQDSLLTWARALGGTSGRIKSSENFHDYIQSVWKETVAKEAGGSAGFQAFWESALRDGVVDVAGKRGGRDKTSGRAFKKDALTAALKMVPKPSDATTLVLFETTGMGDGRQANNAWLQELPDPVSKITWENYAAVSKKTADELKLKSGDLITVTAKIKTAGGEESVSQEVPAFVQPGMADKTVAMPLGWGRERAGQVGNHRGTNAYRFVSWESTGPLFSGLSVEIKKTGGFRALANTQTHHRYDEHGKYTSKYNPEKSETGQKENTIIREASLAAFVENPAAGNEEHEKDLTLWPKHEYKGYRWGMAIDLNSCTGCSACVIACQSENNIPVVGQEQVRKGREMHWIRIDRYYSGDMEHPQAVHQPMLCQHCENAPCETVCPVVATVHSDEGLNEQIYNRCVGTRYCSNNCPYKVRRFNWFNFNYYDRQGLTTPAPAHNPDVSVRFRGVMEKCTFCIQRIKEAKGLAKDKGTKVKDADLKTACQQGCPTDAIMFGNINDPESEVSKLKKDPRAYTVLEELNVRSSITYLTKIRNVEAGPEGAKRHHEQKGHA